MIHFNKVEDFDKISVLTEISGETSRPVMRPPPISTF